VRGDSERRRKELVEFRARTGCNEIGAQPEVTYPAGCGRSGTYVTNTRSIHVAYRRLSGIITKQSFPGSRNPSASRLEDFALACSHAPFPTLSLAIARWPASLRPMTHWLFSACLASPSSSSWVIHRHGYFNYSSSTRRCLCNEHLVRKILPSSWSINHTLFSGLSACYTRQMRCRSEVLKADSH